MNNNTCPSDVRINAPLINNVCSSNVQNTPMSNNINISEASLKNQKFPQNFIVGQLPNVTNSLSPDALSNIQNCFVFNNGVLQLKNMEHDVCNKSTGNVLEGEQGTSVLNSINLPADGATADGLPHGSQNQSVRSAEATHCQDINSHFAAVATQNEIGPAASSADAQILTNTATTAILPEFQPVPKVTHPVDKTLLTDQVSKNHFSAAVSQKEFGPAAFSADAQFLENIATSATLPESPTSPKCSESYFNIRNSSSSCHGKP